MSNLLSPNPSELLRKRPASEALYIMHLAAQEFGLKVTHVRHWPAIFRIVNYKAIRN